MTADVVIDAEDECPGCHWSPGDGINPECHHPQGCDLWRHLVTEELDAERAALAAEGLSV